MKTLMPLLEEHTAPGHAAASRTITTTFYQRHGRVMIGTRARGFCDEARQPRTRRPSLTLR